MTVGLRSVDLNADAGESAADLQLFGTVTTVSLACGGHAGDPGLLRTALERAAALGLAAGAHPSYADRSGFGRVESGLPAAQLRELVLQQLEFLSGLADGAGVSLGHVKAHGALYNRLARDDEALHAFAAAVVEWRPDVRLFLPAGPRFAHFRTVLDGVRVRPVAEAFADRRYLADGRLAPRSLPGAVIADPAAVAGQALTLMQSGQVSSLDGPALAIRADTICLHGDHPGSLLAARTVRTTLESAGFTVQGL